MSIFTEQTYRGMAQFNTNERAEMGEQIIAINQRSSYSVPKSFATHWTGSFWSVYVFAVHLKILINPFKGILSAGVTVTQLTSYCLQFWG